MWRYLTRRHKRRRPRRSRPSQDTIKDRVSIHERPKTVDGRTEGGHWEGDLIICKRTRPVLVLHERKSRVTLAARLAGKARLIFAWSQRRNLAAAHSYAGARPATGYGFGGFSRILSSTRDQPAGEPLTIAKSDYDAFERMRKHPSCLLRRGTFSSARYGHSRLSYFSAELAATRVAVSSIA